MNILTLDTETTGLFVEDDEVVEIGLAIYSTKHDRIMASYGWLHDTSIELTDEVIAVHGLTNKMIKGWDINFTLVNQMFKMCDYYVAHNARFDMPFVQKLLGEKSPAMDKDKWLCSMLLIDWAAKGHKTRHQNYLAADVGFLNPFPHTAAADTMTLARLAMPHIDEMIKAAGYDWVQIRALHAPRETKDKLKERQYRALYEGGKFRYWYKNLMVAPGVLDEERDFLEKEVYLGMARPEKMATKLGKWYDVPSEF